MTARRRDLSQGNFRAVVNFRVDSGDTVLRDHLSECSSRQTYISKTSQNEILSIMGESIRNQIIADVKDSGFYSISIDEVTDVANWEQLGIVLRYVKEGQAIEKLVGFEACKKVCGIDIFNTVKNFLQDCGVDMKLCRSSQPRHPSN